jgi:hypothetical protein
MLTTWVYSTPSTLGEQGRRLAQKMQVGPDIPIIPAGIGLPLQRAEVGRAQLLPGRKVHRVGPNCETRPHTLTENPY